MPHHVCVACSTQFADTAEPPDACPVCDDARQYVPPAGQRWTTLHELREGHRNRIAAQGDLRGVVTEPAFGIGQRALLVPFGATNLLWDCVALLDEETAGAIEERGGLAGVAISHPHYYSTMVEWAERFACPIHLHADDAPWVMRPDPAVRHWTGDTLELGHGLTLVRTGGHFPGSTVLHRETPDGRGELLVGDSMLTVADRRYITALWSYPNRVPLSAHAVRGIRDALAPFSYATLQDAFWDGWRDDAEAVVARSLRRLVEAVEPGAADGAGG